MTFPPAIKSDGSPFTSEELDSLEQHVLSLTQHEERTQFRNANATAIALHGAKRMLIVSGPGTGKSTLFMDRIKAWLEADPTRRILVTTFVKKLVQDLRSDIAKLPPDIQPQVEAHTLHRFARSLLERSGGTEEWPLQKHIRIIGGDWKEVVWGDVAALEPDVDLSQYTWKEFEGQLHDAEFSTQPEWVEARRAYFTLCSFYNAVGFSDLILRATDALAEDGTLQEHTSFIVDEYQDFNAAEDRLINSMTNDADGLLMVGDDDQVLYEQLKRADRGLIRARYEAPTMAKALLPLCGRSSYHVCHAANGFIAGKGVEGRIRKTYLPVAAEDGAPKVRVVVCVSASATVDYVRGYIQQYHEQIASRQEAIEAGKETEPYLLILSPSGKLRYLRSKDANSPDKQLRDLVAPYRPDSAPFGPDYRRLLTYWQAAKYSRDNFLFRRVLHFDGVVAPDIHAIIAAAIGVAGYLSEVDHEAVRAALARCHAIREVLDSQDTPREKLAQLQALVPVQDAAQLLIDITEQYPEKAFQAGETAEEARAEEEETGERALFGAVELMTITGSKGLSAEHVIILGFDDANMRHIDPNGFYVALTRARKSVTLISGLRCGGSKAPHEYLDHMPSQHVEYAKYSKTKKLITRLNDANEVASFCARMASHG